MDRAPLGAGGPAEPDHGAILGLGPEEEREAVQRHPGFSDDILRRVGVFERVAEIAVSHHEHLDGTGPRGLLARQIDLPARILAVATRAEALLADRPHRRAFTWDALLQELAPLVGRKLDERCFRALGELTPR